MLLELWSPAIPQANTAEKHIQFRSGLNVVLGEKGASNSIGKSTSLLILDFCLWRKFICQIGRCKAS